MKLDFYRSGSGESPIWTFLARLEPKARAKVWTGLAALETHGFQLGGGRLKRVAGTDGLWELRVRLASDQYRALFCRGPTGNLVVLHVFRKKSGRIPKRDIALAELRMKDHLEREQ